MPSVVRRTPPEVTTERLRGQTTLLLGAPHVGKSNAAETLTFPTVEDLEGAYEHDADEGLVIDEFYTSVQVAPDGAVERFPEWVAGQETACVTVRPRDLDWLLAAPENDVPLTATLIDAFDQVILCEYGVGEGDQPDETATAIDTCLTIGTAPETDPDPASIDRTALADHIDQLRYPSYEFDTDALAETLGVDRYGPTYLPPLIIYLSDRNLERAVFTEQVVETVRSMGTNFPKEFGIASVISATKDATASLLEHGREVLADPGPLVSGSALIGGSPFLGAAGLALWGVTMDDEPTVDHIFDRILEEELVPPATERIEAALDLPPRTLDNLATLGQPANVARLERLCDSLEGAEATDLEAFEDAIAEADARIDHLESLVDELERTAADRAEYANLISRAIETATDDRGDLAAELVRGEADLLNTPPDTVDIADIVDSYAGNEPEQIARAVRESDLVVLRGGLGTGKTTASYIASDRLAAAGYTPRFPNFEGRSIEFIEHSVRACLDGDTAPVLFVNYRSGAYPFRDEAELRTLIEWTRTDVCECVVIECREEQYRALDKLSMRATSERPVSGAVWRDKEELTFSSFDDAGTIEAVLADALRTYADETLDMDRLAELIEWTDGNVEVAKLVIAHERSSEALVNEYNSIFELLWDDVKGIIGEDDTCAWMFRHVCAARAIETRALREVAGDVPLDRLLLCADDLAEYLGGDVRRELADADGLPSLAADDIWTVSPDIYGDAVFKHDAIYRDNLLKYVSNYVDQEWYGLYTGVAIGLARAYSSTISQETFHTDVDAFQRKATEQTEKLVAHLVDADLPPEVRFMTLRQLEIAYVPLPETALTTMTDALVAGARARGRHHKTDADGEWLDFVGGVIVNRIVADESDPLPYDTIVHCARAAEGDLHRNLANIFAYANASVIRYQDEVRGADMEMVFDTINWQAHLAARDGQLEVDPHWFLMNYYPYLASMIFEQDDEFDDAMLEDALELLFTRAERTVGAFDWDDHTFIEGIASGILGALAGVTNAPGEHGSVQTRLSHIAEWLDQQRRRPGFDDENVIRAHADAVKFLAGRYDDPEDAAAWIATLEAQAIDAVNCSPGDAMLEFYVTLLKRVAVGYHLQGHQTEIETLDPWLNTFEHRLVERAIETEIPTARLLFNTYANVQLRTLGDGPPDQEPIRACLRRIDERAEQMADARVHRSPPERFLANYYRNLLLELFVQFPSPTAPPVQVCFDVIPERLFQSSDYPLTVAGTAYGGFLTADELLEERPDDVQEWVDAVARARREACETASTDLSVADVEKAVNRAVFQYLVREFPTPDSDSLDEWQPVFHDRAWRAATAQSTHPPGAVMVQVYGPALGTTARHFTATDGESVEPGDGGWIQQLVDELRDVGNREQARLPPAVLLPNGVGAATTAAQEFLPGPERPATRVWVRAVDVALETTLEQPELEADPADVRVTALAYMATQAQQADGDDTSDDRDRNEDGDGDWTAAFTAAALAQLSPDLYGAYYSRRLEAWIQQKDPTGFIRIADDVISRTLGPDPLYEAREDRIDLLARVFAEFGYWAVTEAEIVGSDRFYTQFSGVGSIVNDGVETAFDLLDAMDHRLAVGELGLWLDPEEMDGAARAQIRAQVLAATYPHLLTSIYRLEIDEETRAAAVGRLIADAVDRLAAAGDDEWFSTAVTRLLNAVIDTGAPQAAAERVVEGVIEEASPDVLTDIYITALRAIRDADEANGCRTLAGLWYGRTALPKGSDARQQARAAGVGYAASFELADDYDSTNAKSIIAELDDHRVSLPEPAVELLHALETADPGNVATADAEAGDGESDSIQAIEQAAYGALTEKVTSTVPREYAPQELVQLYAQALVATLDGEIEDAINQYYIVWGSREHLSADADIYPHCLEAGIRLQAYGTQFNLNPEVTVDEVTVDEYRDRLASPVVELYDYVRGAAERPATDRLLSDVDTSSDQFSVYELQRLATATMLGQLEKAVAADEADEANAGSTDEDASAPDDIDVDIEATYWEAIDAICKEDFATAIDRLDIIWDHREETAAAAPECTANAGVAYAVLIHDDSILSARYERLLEELRERAEDITGPYTTLFEQLTADERCLVTGGDDLSFDLDSHASTGTNQAKRERHACRVLLDWLT